jgi:hypothetical protein
MSSKLKKIFRTIGVASYTWAANVLTINTSAAHGLLAGDSVYFMDQNFPQGFTGALASVPTTTSFTIATTNNTIKVPGSIQTNIFNATATGAQEAFTWGWGTYPAGAVQVSTNSTGTVTVKVEASLDGVKWVDAAAAQAITANSSFIFDIAKPYIYGRLNFTIAVGGAGGKVTAVKTVA